MSKQDPKSSNASSSVQGTVGSPHSGKPPVASNKPGTSQHGGKGRIQGSRSRKGVGNSRTVPQANASSTTTGAPPTQRTSNVGANQSRTKGSWSRVGNRGNKFWTAYVWSTRRQDIPATHRVTFSKAVTTTELVDWERRWRAGGAGPTESPSGDIFQTVSAPSPATRVQPLVVKPPNPPQLQPVASTSAGPSQTIPNQHATPIVAASVQGASAPSGGSSRASGAPTNAVQASAGSTVSSAVSPPVSAKTSTPKSAPTNVLPSSVPVHVKVPQLGGNGPPPPKAWSKVAPTPFGPTGAWRVAKPVTAHVVVKQGANPATAGHNAPWRQNPHSTAVPGAQTGNVTQALPPQTQNSRARPAFAGQSTALTVAQSATTTRPDTLPLKAPVATRERVPRRAPREERRRCQKWIPDSDNELIYYLKVEAMYQDRTTTLARILHGKAKRFLEKFDTCDLTWERRYIIIASAVRTAMMIDEVEDGLRQTLKNVDQQELIEKNHKFLTKGVVGNSGPNFFGLGRKSKVPT